MFRLARDSVFPFYVATFDETITDEEFLDAFSQMIADPTADLLLDLRTVKHVEVQRETIRRTIYMLSDATQQVRHKIAVVASSDVVFGMARMYEAMRPQSLSLFNVFRDFDSAKEWLTTVPEESR